MLAVIRRSSIATDQGRAWRGTMTSVWMVAGMAAIRIATVQAGESASPV